MANLALALAFVISFLLSPGGRILRMLVDAPVLQSLPPYQGHLLLAFANYWIPAVLIYVMLRMASGNNWLRPRTAIHALLGLGNVLLVFYVAARTFASTIQGGGASFVVMSFAPFVLWPALSMLAIGLGWLVVRTIRQRKEPFQKTARSFSLGDGIALVALVGIPCSAVASTLFFAENAPFRLAREAEKTFQNLCGSAGEKILETPQGVESVYLDPNGTEYFQDIVKGVYGGHGSSTLGDTLVFQGQVLYFEETNFRQKNNTAARYLKHGLRDWKGEPGEELTSNFGVFQKSAVSDAVEKKLGVRGKEVAIRNLRTGQTTATLTYFTSQRHRTICGHSGDGRFDVRDFIQRALNLTQRFPGGTAQIPPGNP